MDEYKAEVQVVMDCPGRPKREDNYNVSETLLKVIRNCRNYFCVCDL